MSLFSRHRYRDLCIGLGWAGGSQSLSRVHRRYISLGLSLLSAASTKIYPTNRQVSTSLFPHSDRYWRNLFSTITVLILGSLFWVGTGIYVSYSYTYQPSTVFNSQGHRNGRHYVVKKFLFGLLYFETRRCHGCSTHKCVTVVLFTFSFSPNTDFSAKLLYFGIHETRNILNFHNIAHLSLAAIFPSIQGAIRIILLYWLLNN